MNSTPKTLLAHADEAIEAVLQSEPPETWTGSVSGHLEEFRKAHGLVDGDIFRSVVIYWNCKVTKRAGEAALLKAETAKHLSNPKALADIASKLSGQ